MHCSNFHWQSQSDGESHRSNMEKEDPRSSPSPPSTPSICSPPSSASSVPSTGKNVCASCGLEILDRYLLKVRARDCVCVCRLMWRVNCFWFEPLTDFGKNVCKQHYVGWNDLGYRLAFFIIFRWLSVVLTLIIGIWYTAANLVDRILYRL